MVHSYPEALFLEDFQVLGVLAPAQTILEHMVSRADTAQVSQWRFNVFCKTILVLNEFKKEEEFRGFVESHADHSETEVLGAVARAVHFLVKKNMDGNLSYHPSWDETGLTARLYLGPLNRGVPGGEN